MKKLEDLFAAGRHETALELLRDFVSRDNIPHDDRFEATELMLNLLDVSAVPDAMRELPRESVYKIILQLKYLIITNQLDELSLEALESRCVRAQTTNSFSRVVSVCVLYLDMAGRFSSADTLLSFLLQTLTNPEAQRTVAELVLNRDILNDEPARELSHSALACLSARSEQFSETALRFQIKYKFGQSVDRPDTSADEHAAHRIERAIRQDPLGFGLPWGTAAAVPRDTGRRRIEFFWVIYGSDYASFALEVGLKSLLQNGEVEVLSQSYNVVFWVCTTTETVPQLRDFFELLDARGLAYHVDTDTLKDNGSATALRGLAYYFAFRRSVESRGIFVGCAPDLYFGAGITNLVARCTLGGGSTCDHLRVSKESFLSHLPAIQQGTASANGLERNRLLVRLGLGKLSHFLTRRPFVIGTKKRNYTVTENAVAVRTSTTAILALNFDETLLRGVVESAASYASGPILDRFLMAIDHWLMWELTSTGRLQVCDSDEFLFIELSTNRGYSNLFKIYCCNYKHPGFSKAQKRLSFWHF